LRDAKLASHRTRRLIWTGVTFVLFASCLGFLNDFFGWNPPAVVVWLIAVSSVLGLLAPAASFLYDRGMRISVPSAVCLFLLPSAILLLFVLSAMIHVIFAWYWFLYAAALVLSVLFGLALFTRDIWDWLSRTHLISPAPCASCGYNRTGLPSTAVCPECGGPPPQPDAPADVASHSR
jgi:hypothetical protein